MVFDQTNLSIINNENVFRSMGWNRGFKIFQVMVKLLLTLDAIQLCDLKTSSVDNFDTSEVSRATIRITNVFV